MALSLDLRYRIVQAYKNEEGSVRRLAERFCVSARTVWSLLQQDKKEGQLEPRSPPGRSSVIDPEGLCLIASWIKEKNDLTLTELCKAYADKKGISCSVMAMHRACKKLNLPYKKNKARVRATTSRDSRGKKRV